MTKTNPNYCPCIDKEMRTLKDCCNEASQLHNFHNLLAPQKISERFGACLSIAVPQKQPKKHTLSHPSPPFSFFKIWVCKLNSYTFVLGQTAQDTCAWPAPGNDNIISLSIPLLSNKRNVTEDDW
jgi:hypothetical protein